MPLPTNSSYGGPTGRVDFWLGQGARASRPCGVSENGRDARSPRPLPPQLLPNHTRRARVQGLLRPSLDGAQLSH